MSILYFCHLCGGSVEAGDEPEAWDPEDDIFACDTCFPITQLALTRDQMSQVVAWIWTNMADEA
jgi:hypothetical protein